MNNLYTYLVTEAVHPNYVILSKLLQEEGITNYPEFESRYGEETQGLEAFKKQYMERM
jgi:hypothetical protein